MLSQHKGILLQTSLQADPKLPEDDEPPVCWRPSWRADSSPSWGRLMFFGSLKLSKNWHKSFLTMERNGSFCLWCVSVIDWSIGRGRNTSWGGCKAGMQFEHVCRCFGACSNTKSRKKWIIRPKVHTSEARLQICFGYKRYLYFHPSVEYHWEMH